MMVAHAAHARRLPAPVPGSRDTLRRACAVHPPLLEHRLLEGLARRVSVRFERELHLGVAFTQEPQKMGPVTTAVFSDTCGNLIQLYQPG